MKKVIFIIATTNILKTQAGKNHSGDVTAPAVPNDIPSSQMEYQNCVKGWGQLASQISFPNCLPDGI